MLSLFSFLSFFNGENLALNFLSESFSLSRNPNTREPALLFAFLYQFPDLDQDRGDRRHSSPETVAAMTEPPANHLVSSENSGEVPVRIERDIVGDNGGDESGLGSRVDTSAGHNRLEVERGEASVGDALVNDSAGDSPGL